MQRNSSFHESPRRVAGRGDSHFPEMVKEMLEDIKREYQEEVEKLQKRRNEILEKLPELRGTAYFRALKRISLLYQEEEEMLYAIGQIAKSERKKSAAQSLNRAALFIFPTVCALCPALRGCLGIAF